MTRIKKRGILNGNIIKEAEGFTLLEATFVLSIVFLLTLVVLPLGNKWMRTSAEEEAIAAIVTTIHSLQSYSMAHNAHTRLSFQSAGTRTEYVAAQPGVREFSRRLLPEGMHLSDSSALKTVEFYGNGDIRHSGVLTIVGKTGRTTITFQFQRGRMIISERERIFMAGDYFNGGGTFHCIRHAFAARNKYDNAII